MNHAPALPSPIVCPSLLDLTGGISGYTVWLDERRVVCDVPLDEARAIYRRIQALALQGSDQLNRILNRRA